MNDTQRSFSELIYQLTLPNNDQRRAGEDQFQNFLSYETAMTFEFLAQMTHSAPQVDIRKMSAILFRRYLAKYRSNVNIEALKEHLLRSLKTQENLVCLRQLADAASKLAEVIAASGDKNTPNPEWSEFYQLLSEWTGSEFPKLREIALYILTNLIRSNSLGENILPQISNIFLIRLVDQSPQVKIAALQGIAMMLITGYLAPQAVNDHMGEILNLIKLLVKEVEEEAIRAIGYLIEMGESCPELFRAPCDQFLELFFSIISNDDFEEATRNEALEFIVTLIEQKPGMFRKRPEFMQVFIKLLLQRMMEIDDDPEWNRKDRSDGDDGTRNPASESLDRLSIAIRGQTVVPILFGYIQELIKDAHWTKRYVAIMAISISAEGCLNFLLSHMDDVVRLLVPAFEDQHQRVRWAACNAVGQIANDFSQHNFQQIYGPQLLPLIMHVMNDFKNPRVQSHACAAIVNFCEPSPAEVVTPFLADLMRHLALIFQNNPREIVLEQAITAVSAIADCVREAMTPWYKDLVNYLKSILVLPVNKEFAPIKGRAIEALSMLAIAVGKPVFVEDAEEVLKILLNIQGNLMPGYDPQASFLKTAWARLCKVLKEDFVPYLSYVLPELFEIIKQDVNIIVLDVDDTTFNNDENWQSIPVSDRKIWFNTALLKEKSAACTMVCCYIEELVEGYYPFADTTFDIMSNFINFIYNQGVRSACSTAMPLILRCIKGHFTKSNMDPSEKLLQFYKIVFDKFSEALKTEVDVPALSTELDSLGQCIDILGPLWYQPNYAASIMETYKSLIDDLNFRRSDRLAQINDQDCDTEEKERLRQETEDDSFVLISIEELMTKALKNAKEQFAAPYEQFFQDFLHFMDPTYLPCEINAALCACMDLIDAAPEIAQKYFETINSTVLNLCTCNVATLRQTSSYGVGLLALTYPHLFAPYLPSALEKLYHVLTSEDSRNPEFEAASENATTAIGRVLESKPELIAQHPNLVSLWLNFMPILSDKSEVPVACRQLWFFYTTAGPILMGENFENLTKILLIIATYIQDGLVPPNVEQTLRSMVLHIIQSVPGNLVAMAFDNIPDERAKAALMSLSSGGGQ